jgi:hypothetical protein
MNVQSKSIPALLLLLLSACQLNPYDEDQAPSIQIGDGLTPTINWQPQGAQVVRVYQANNTGVDGLMWLISAKQDNGIQAPLTYGVLPPQAQSSHPATPLQVGEKYLVIVQRKDANASGNPLANTLNEYGAQQSFEAQLPLPPAFDGGAR